MDFPIVQGLCNLPRGQEPGEVLPGTEYQLILGTHRVPINNREHIYYVTDTDEVTPEGRYRRIKTTITNQAGLGTHIITLRNPD